MWDVAVGMVGVNYFGGLISYRGLVGRLRAIYSGIMFNRYGNCFSLIVVGAYKFVDGTRGSSLTVLRGCTRLGGYNEVKRL